MSNLARRYQQELPDHKQQRKIRKIRVKKTNSTAAYKFVGTLIMCFTFICAIKIVSNWAYLYNVNVEIQDLQHTLQEQQKHNDDLVVQVSELSTYERIWAIAAEMGLTLNENNVKVVGN